MIKKVDDSKVVNNKVANNKVVYKQLIKNIHSSETFTKFSDNIKLINKINIVNNSSVYN